MNVLGWIILGGLAGWIASKVVGADAHQGALGNIIFGIIGAVLGGWLVEFLGGEGITGFNLWSFVVALAGAVLVVGGYHALAGGRRHTL